MEERTERGTGGFWGYSFGVVILLCMQEGVCLRLSTYVNFSYCRSRPLRLPRGAKASHFVIGGSHSRILLRVFRSWFFYLWLFLRVLENHSALGSIVATLLEKLLPVTSERDVNWWYTLGVDPAASTWSRQCEALSNKRETGWETSLTLGLSHRRVD